MQELEGQIIEHYRILHRLTRGGMSDIYLAQDTQTERTVVVKLVHNSNREYYERFRSEVKATAALKHDHILPAFAHGEHGSWCYMVSPYIEDGTLNDLLIQGSLELRETGQILEQLASALQFAHDQGIIHRDIKPSNILMRNREHVYLGDFGLARHIDEDNGLTVTGYLIGTPEYMAPELAEEAATIKSDIYALGVVLYQLLTGQVPFKGSTPMGTYLKHIRERPIPPRQVNASIPEEIEEVILRALEKRPGHRFSSVRELADAYHKALVQSQKQISKQEEQSSLQEWVKYPAIKQRAVRGVAMHRVLLGLVATFCFVCIPTVLGFTFYNANRHINSEQIKGVGADISGAEPVKTVTVVVTSHPQSTPTSTVQGSGKQTNSSAIIIQITQNGNNDENGQQSGTTNGGGTTGGGDKGNGHGQGKGHGGGGNKGKK